MIVVVSKTWNALIKIKHEVCKKLINYSVLFHGGRTISSAIIATWHQTSWLPLALRTNRQHHFCMRLFMVCYDAKSYRLLEVTLCGFLQFQSDSWPVWQLFQFSSFPVDVIDGPASLLLSWSPFFRQPKSRSLSCQTKLNCIQIT